MKASTKRFLLTALALVLVAAISIGGTIAFLRTGEETYSNVFTIGDDISIKLTEDTGVIRNGETLPTTTEDGKTISYGKVLPGDYLKKVVTVTNDGDIDAYVKVIVKLNNVVAMNAAIDDYYEDLGYTDAAVQAMYDYIFDGWGWNYTHDSASPYYDMRGTISGADMPEFVMQVDSTRTLGNYWLKGADNWFELDIENNNDSWVDAHKVNGDFSLGYYASGMKADEHLFAYYLLLPAGESTTLFKGINVPAEFTYEQLKMFENFKIDVTASAIQVDNIASGLEVGSVEHAKAAFSYLAEMEDGKNAVGEPIVYATTAGELAAAIANGGYVGLANNIEVDETLVIAAGEAVKLDLNGNTLNGDIEVVSGASLTVENGKVENTDNAVSAIQNNGGNVVLNNVEVSSARHAIRVEGGVVTINGGVYTVAPDTAWTLHAVNVSDGGTVIINGGTFIGPKGTMADSGSAVNVQVGATAVINGGDFSGGKIDTLLSQGSLTVNGGTFDQDPSAYAVGCKVTEENGKWTVSAYLNDAEVDEALKAGKTVIALGSGKYIIPDSAKGKTLTFIGNGATVIENQNDGSYEGCDYSLEGSTVTFENLTITTDSHTYAGYARMDATYNNCTVNGTYTLYGNSEFNGCTFNVSGDAYNIWTWGAPVATFNDCTFNSSGKSILAYGNTNTTVNVNDCVFNDDDKFADVNNKAAIETGSDWDADTKTLVINNVTVNGFDITDKGYYTGTPIYGDKNSLTEKGRLTVIIDGKQLVADAEDLKDALAEGGNVVLSGNVAVSENLTMSGGTLDGNGNKLDVSNVDVNSDCAITTTGGTVKNITITGNSDSTRAIGSGSSGDSSLTKDLYIDNVTIDEVMYAINGGGSANANVYVTDSTVYGWLSFSGINSFNFEKCTIGQGNSYDGYMVVYGTTNFTGCTFESTFDMGARAENGVVLAAGKTITFTDCTYDGVKVTAENFVEHFYYGPGDETDFGNLMRECTIIVDGVTVDNSAYIN